MDRFELLAWLVCRRCWETAYLLSYFDVPLCRGHVHEIAAAYDRARSWPDAHAAPGLTPERRDRIRLAIAGRQRANQ